MSSSVVSTEIRVPRLASASSAQSGLPHALWRPQMQTLLMRCGVEERDYSREFPEWKKVVATIDADVEAEEEAAFAAVLGTAASSAAPAVKKQALTAEEQKQKQRVIAAIARMRKAYALLYAALPADLRALVADVPQGYAFGIWSMLEKKFRNTEQDSVMALWERLISLRQEREPEESFDEYKARVDAVVELLHNAKQTVEAGLYTSLLLWRLQPHYATAVLTLKTGDRLKDPSKIDWTYIVEYMGQFERSQLGLNDRDMEPGGNSNYHAYSARHKQQYNGDRSKKPRGYNDLADVKCYNCNKLGHYASDCSQPDRRQENKQRRGDKPRDELQDSTSEMEDSDQHTDGAGASDSDDADESRQRRRRVDEEVNMSRALSNMKLGKHRDSSVEHTGRTSTAGRSYLMRASIATGQEQHQKQTRRSPEQESRARSQREPNRRARGIGAAAARRQDAVKKTSFREGSTLKNSVEHESQLQGGC
jgi:hypothetical protein